MKCKNGFVDVNLENEIISINLIKCFLPKKAQILLSKPEQIMLSFLMFSSDKETGITKMKEKTLATSLEWNINKITHIIYNLKKENLIKTHQSNSSSTCEFTFLQHPIYGAWK